MARPRKTPVKREKTDELRHRAAVGDKAKRLAEDELLIQALEAMNEHNLEQFRAAKTVEETWAAKQAHTASEAFQRHLVGYILAGRDAMALLRAGDEVAAIRAETYSFDDYKARAMKAREEWAKAQTGDTT